MIVYTYNICAHTYYLVGSVSDISKHAASLDTEVIVLSPGERLRGDDPKPPLFTPRGTPRVAHHPELNAYGCVGVEEVYGIVLCGS